MADGKPFSAWLSGDLLDKAVKRCDSTADGNISKYVKGLIERDVDSSPETLLIELAKRYQPSLVDQLEKARAKQLLIGEVVDGRVVLARFLDAYAAAIEDPEFQPQRPFLLADAAKAGAWEQISEERIVDLARRVAEIQSGYLPRDEDGSEDLKKLTASEGYGDVKVTIKQPGQKAVKVSTRGRSEPVNTPASTGQPKLTPHPSDQSA